MKIDGNMQYKKSWLIGTMIARELIGIAVGDRLPTIAEYTQRLGSSRGLVQNALDMLQKEKAICLEKRGKIGTFVVEYNQQKLFELANLEYITASMAPPLSLYFAGLATGVCVSIKECPVPFNFSFMHSSESRAKMLNRMAYDFIIVSHYSAKKLVEKYPDLAVAMLLEDAVYAPPFYLCSNRKGVRQIADGDRIVADMHSTDQYEVTQQLCAGKKVTLLQEPYLATKIAFDNGKADFVVQRQGEYDWSVTAEIIPIENEQNKEMTLPAVVVNTKNYCMDKIVAKYLDQRVIATVQTEVIQKKRELEFY